MVFFELVRKITSGDFSSVVNAFGDLIKPIGGKGVGSFVPNPKCYQEGPIHYAAGAVQLDESGNVLKRNQVLTDEGSFKDDFEILNVPLTGILTFHNGNTTVTGVGTLFTTELDNQTYIGLATDRESSWALVADVISDTELELDRDYTGLGGSGIADKTFWRTITGTGGTVSTANSILTIASGTTVSSIIQVNREVDYGPIQSVTYAAISQRIANQTAVMGFSSDVADPVNANPNICAYFLFDGTSNTVVKCVVKSGPNTSAYTETSTVTLPGGATTASYNLYQIVVTPEFVKFSINSVLVADYRVHIPNPYKELNSVLGWVNGSPAPASNSNLLIDNQTIGNSNRLEISEAYQGDSIPVRVREETHYITGNLSNNNASEVVVLSYLVPTNRTFRLLGYSFTGDNTSAIGTCRISLAAPPNTDPISPGVVDGTVFGTNELAARVDLSENFCSVPMLFANAGQTVYVTLQQAAPPVSVIWRARLDFILR